MKSYNQEEMLREVFDAMPSMVFIVDHDVRIQRYNKAASDFLKMEKTNVLKQHGGKILQCINAEENNDSCGITANCESCIIRKSVKIAFNGDRVTRARTRLDLIKNGKKEEIYALITTSPFFCGEEKLVLLVIEDISIIAELQRMIPICSVCHKIRDENDVWSRIESYFKENWDVDFTHGICPGCHKKEMDKLKERKKRINIKKNI